MTNEKADAYRLALMVDSRRFREAVEEKRMIYVPRDGDGSYFQECASAQHALEEIEKSHRNCFDQERYGARLVGETSLLGSGDPPRYS
jgi:hypothetical protein